MLKKYPLYLSVIIVNIRSQPLQEMEQVIIIILNVDHLYSLKFV